MTAPTFLLVVVCGAAFLAVWLYVRLEARAPDEMARGLAHCLASFGMAWLAVPALRYAVGSGMDPGAAVLTIVLPAFTYVLLASLWMLRLVQQLLPGIGRR